MQIDSAPKNERLIADALLAKLRSLGLTVTEDDSGAKIGGNAGNILGVLEGEKAAPPLLFCAHMDRVHPGFGIQPQLKGGLITSDGTTILAADDVAGIVAILEAVRIMKEQEIPHGRIEILFTVAEEGGLFGAKSLDASTLQAKAGFFLDSSGPVGSIVVQAPAQKGLRQRSMEKRPTLVWPQKRVLVPSWSPPTPSLECSSAALIPKQPPILE